jgi:soluble cytochrome b562
MQASREQMAAATEEIKENDYSPYQVNKLNQALAEYNKVDDDPNSPTFGLRGAEAGRKFSAPNFYEEIDIGKTVDERVKGIAAIKSGGAQFNPETGEYTGDALTEKVSGERVFRSAMGVLQDEKVRRQVYDEYVYDNPDEEPTNEKLAEYFVTKYVDGALGKYAREGSVTDIDGSNKGPASNTVAGGVAPVSSPTRSVTLDTYDFMGQERTPHQVNNRLRELAAMRDSGEYPEGIEPNEVDLEYTLLANSLHTALFSETAGEPLIDDAADRKILSSIPSEELWTVMDTSTDVPELQQAADAFLANEPNGWLHLKRLLQERGGNNGHRPLQNLFSDWDFEAAKLAKELLKDRNDLTDRQKANPQGTQEYKDARDKVYREGMMEYINNLESITERFDRAGAAELIRKYQPDLSDEQVNDLVGKLYTATVDGPFHTAYQDATEAGRNAIVAERREIGIETIANQGQLDQLNGALRRQFGGTLESSNLDVFTVLGEDGRPEPLDKNLLKLLDFGNLEVEAVEVSNAAGFIKIRVPSLEEGGQDRRLDINLTKSSATNNLSNVQEAIVGYARDIAADRRADGDLVQSAREVSFGLGYTEALNKGLAAFSHNADLGPGLPPAPISADVVDYAFGKVTPKTNADGEYYFTDGNNKNLFGPTVTFTSAHQAMHYLIDKARERFKLGKA